MSQSKKFQFFLPIIVFLAGMLPVLYNLGTMGLLESTESLIASVARYMVDTQNFSTPIYNDIKIFDYAPGVYWITSLGLKLFGFKEFGARFFLCIASGITAVSIFFIAKLFFGTQCAVISSLLLCTSLLFQISFRVISPAAYCVAFESVLCLFFFYYLNKPSNPLRTFFWLVLSFGFLFNGISIFYPVIALTLVALYTGQKESIFRLYKFTPGIINFIVFGLGWYFIQIILNPGLFSYYLYELPVKNFFKAYNGFPFWAFIFLPLFAVFPWTSIWLEDIKIKIKNFKDEPFVTYLVSWAFFPYMIHLFMTSREYTDFISSLPPLLLLTAPAFRSIYLNKDNKTGKTMEIVKKRRRHNLILAISISVIGLLGLYYGGINFEKANVVSQSIIFLSIFWLFSALTIVAFMLKKLNKSVIIPAGMLVPSLILFSSPAIKGHEPISEGVFLSSKHVLLKRIGRMPANDFIFCVKPIYGTYFYTGRKFKFYSIDEELKFITSECYKKYIVDEDSLREKMMPESFLVLPSNSKNHISNKLRKKLNLSAEESDWIVVVQGEKIY